MVIQGSRVVSHGSRWVLWFLRFQVCFPWFQVGFHGFSRFQVGFSRFQLGFEDKSWLHVGFYSYRSVFIVTGRFFMVPGCFFFVFYGSRSGFYDSRWIFIVRLVSIQTERRRREVRC